MEDSGNFSLVQDSKCFSSLRTIRKRAEYNFCVASNMVKIYLNERRGKTQKKVIVKYVFLICFRTSVLHDHFMTAQCAKLHLKNLGKQYRGTSSVSTLTVCEKLFLRQVLPVPRHGGISQCKISFSLFQLKTREKAISHVSRVTD